MRVSLPTVVLLLCLPLLLYSGALSGQHPAATPTALFDAEVRIDPETGRISGHWRYTLPPLPPGGETVTFALAQGMEVREVRGSRVQFATSEPAGEGPPFRLHTVHLGPAPAPGPDDPGTGIQIEIDYEGSPYFAADGMTRLDGEWVELMLDSFWFPLLHPFESMIQGELRVALPERWTVISGREAVLREGLHHIPFPEAGPDVHLSAAPAITRIHRSGFVLFHRGAPTERVDLLLEAAGDCAAYLNERYGQEDPLRDVRILLTERTEVSYYRDNYISIDGSGLRQLAQAHALFCHEMAHHWSRTADFAGPDHWMSEAFAEYVTARFLRWRHGADSFQEQMAEYARVAEGLGPVWTPDLTDRPSHLLMYRKGPVLLHRLEERIGEHAFDELLRRYMTGRVGRTRDLLEILRDVAGQEAEAAFRLDLASAS